MDFSTQPRYTAVMKTSMLLLALAATAIPCHATTRESFDDAWKFARFGPMPDGSQRDEPGTPPQTIKATSSEPANPPANAIDRDPQTRWCAASGSPNEAITLDLGRAGRLSGIEIDWEKQASYSFKAEISTDGQAWKTAADGSASTNTSGREAIRTNDTARYIRITVLKPALAQWASIRELRALDARGNPVTPQPPGPATVATQRAFRAAVLESELRLAPHQGYLLLPDGLPVARVGLTADHIQARGTARQPAFVAGDPAGTLWSRVSEIARNAAPDAKPGPV